MITANKLTYYQTVELKKVYVKKELDLKNSSENACKYYPFGLTIGGLGYVSGDNLASQKYKYNGKEEQDDFNLGWIDYGFRFYDPKIARWMCVDPMIEKHYEWSPYVYALNNPIRFIDPDGNEVKDPNGPNNPPRYATNNINRRPPSAGTIEYNRYNPISRGNKVSVTYFEPQKSTQQQQITRGNVAGNGLSGSVSLLNAVVEHVKTKTNKPSINGYTTRTDETIKVAFSDNKSQKEFDQMQSSYESNLNSEISKIDKPVHPGGDASSEQMGQYNIESAAYDLQVAATKLSVGSSPKEQVLGQVQNNDNVKKVTTTKQLPIVYETPRP